MKITPNVLAQIVGGTVEGDGDRELTGFAKIEEAGPGDISFITNPKYARYAVETKAAALLVNDDFKPEGKVSATLLKVKDAYTALALLLQRFGAEQEDKRGIEQPSFIAQGVNVPDDAYVGAFSYIDKDVEIGSNVKIYPHSYIGKGCKIGKGSVIFSGVNVYDGCVIGENCILHSGAVIGSHGFGFAPNQDGHYEKIPQIGNVVLEDDVEIGANTVVDRATMGSTVIGKGTKLDNLIQVAHNVRIGRNNVFAAQTGIAGSTKIGDHNRIGGQVGFSGHINFGSNCEVGAQSGIPKGYGDGVRIIGYPAMEDRKFARLQVYLKQLPEVIEKIRKL